MLTSYSSSEKQVAVPGEDLAEERRELASSKKTSAEEEKELLDKLQTWLQQERDRQADNRFQMALDHDFYDGLQWTEDDAKTIEERGQAPLVFNEIKVSLDWIIGTEKKNKVDWRVMPRAETDVSGSEVKTKVMKYISDVNKVQFIRSQSFAEAAICGLSWLEDSLSDDATADILYAGHESWRNILHDSYAKRLDLRDGRYLFRWRIVDLDVAQAMFPDKKEELKRAAAGADQLLDDEDMSMWYLGQPLADHHTSSATSTRRSSVISTEMNAAFNRRERVKIYECWYRVPEQRPIMRGGQFDGELYNENDRAMTESIERGESDHIPSLVMRMHCAFFTEEDLLSSYESPFRHNDFPFTPVWCFRRGRDNAPYGFVRNIRDPQEDLNKRMSKSLFLLSVNQLITEFGAFEAKGEYSLQDAIENVSNPQGVFVMKDGSKKFEIRRDFAELQGHKDQIVLNRQFIQSGSGVTDELLGRKTNATSGLAIEARQEQGSTTTSSIFDNYRLAIALSGQKQLSNAEKFYSLPKVIRLTEGKGKIDWVKINQPEIQPDGTVRFLNDITASKADFVVDEQDYRASMRQAMFESLSDMITRIATVAPQFAVGMLDLLVDMADFPGKEEMVERIKMLIAESRGETKTEEQVAAETEAMELQKRKLASEIGKNEATANKSDAEADQIRATIPATAIAMDLENVSQAQAISGQSPMQPMDQAQLAQKAAMGQPAAPAAPGPGMPLAPNAPPVGGMNAGQGTGAPNAQSAPLGGVPASPGVAPGVGSPSPALIDPASVSVHARVNPQAGGASSAPSPSSLPGAEMNAAGPSHAAPAAAPDHMGTMATTMKAMVELMQQSAQVAANAAQTSAQVMKALQGVAATIEGVASSVEQVAGIAAEGTKSAEAASKTAADASESVKKVADAVTNIVKTVETVASEVTDGKKATSEMAQAIVELKKPRNKTIEMKTADGKTIKATIKG